MKKLALVCLIVMCGISCLARATDCTGKVDLIGSGINGDVVVRGPGGLQPIYVCNLMATTANGTSVEVCSTWYSNLLAAYSSASDVTIAIPGSAACDSFQGWQYTTGVTWVFSRKD